MYRYYNMKNLYNLDKNDQKIVKEGSINGNMSSWGEDGKGKKWTDYDTILCPDGQVIDMQKLLDDQQRAKAALVHLQPFFGGFINKLHMVYTFKVKTQATDNFYLFVNPQFTYNLDLTAKVFVMAHEIMHCVLNHIRRGKGHDPQRSNIAADYECNITLADEMDIVKIDTMKKIGAYVDPKYSGWGYEKIYADCSANAKDNMNNKDQSKDAQNQQGDQDQQGGSGQNGNQKQSADYIKGWNQAMEDYKKGKLKI